MANDQSGDDLRLIIGYRNYSSWSMRGWLVARLSGLTFSETVIPLDQPETAAMLAEHSPSRRVPCLVHGDLTIWDTLAITEYLAELAPDAGIWPADRQQRAQARAVVAEMHSSFTALRGQFPMDMVRHHPSERVDDAVAADIRRIEQIWSDCLDRSGGPFLFGAWSAADCFYAPVVSRFETYGFSVGSGTADYMGRVRDHPQFQEWYKAARQEPWVTDLATLRGL